MANPSPRLPAPPPVGPEPVPAPPPVGRRPRRLGLWFLALGLAAGAGLYQLSRRSEVAGARASAVAAVRTAVAGPAEMVDTLRVSGAIAARDYAAIRAPELRGMRQSLTLVELAEPGTVIPAGATAAVFEGQALEDAVDDLRSNYVQVRSQVERARADAMITRAVDRQAARAAAADLDKALLDLRTTSVRSRIQAEVLENLAAQARVTAEQLAREAELKENVHEASLRVSEIAAEKARIALERGERDLERMELPTPVGGLVVLEPIFSRGQIQQIAAGEQVNPGSVFLRVVDLSDMIVSAAINQVDIHGVRLGQRATVRLDAYPDLELEGRIVGLGALAEEGSGGGGFRRGGSGLYVKSVAVEIAIETSDPRVIPDLSAAVDIETARRSYDVVVPREALRIRDGRPAVRVETTRGVETREVEILAINEIQAAVSGLEAGAAVRLGP